MICLVETFGAVLHHRANLALDIRDMLAVAGDADEVAKIYHKVSD